MRSAVGFFIALLLAACVSRSANEAEAPNCWSDERLLPVLDAQEHRDVERLCALLKDPEVTVREAAALAFASVQDSASIPCLLAALRDDSSRVRTVAAFALGFVADSLALEDMAQHAMNEPDPEVQQAYFSASFIAMQRTGHLKDPSAILYFLESSKGHDRVRAADALRKVNSSKLDAMGPEYIDRWAIETDPDVKATMIRGMRSLPGELRSRAFRLAFARDQPLPVRVNAVQFLASGQDVVSKDTLAALLNDPEPMLRSAALSALGSSGAGPSPEQLFKLNEALPRNNALERLGLYGLMMLFDETVALAADSLATSFVNAPYAEAARITARYAFHDGFRNEGLETIMLGNEHPAVRQAAFGALAMAEDRRMMMPRAISYDQQLAEAAPFWRSVFESRDAGLVCAAAEHLQLSGPRELKMLFPSKVEAVARASLVPVRDLEAYQLLNDLAARRDALPPPASEPPAFNHPIDPIRLRALKQGQRYRIVTTKGEIIIATDVNDCPGSSLAFDSLATAGYYDGKAFHRVVPNFVIQGGCPRGDGYGGMPWTLRTEIGRTPFTAGSVGLASAGSDTESCQFFITHSATPHLDGRYTRFGEVVSGMDVVWKIQVGDVMERVEPMN